MDFPHYRTLAAAGFAPWQGAHALRLRLSGTATAYIQEDTAVDTTLGNAIYLWMPVCIGTDLTLTAGDTVILLALQSTGAVNEVVVGVRNNGGTYELFAGETGATNTVAITRESKRWYQVELGVTVDAGGANNGTIDFYVDGAPVGAQITGLDQGAIDQLQIGAVSGTAAGNVGTILIGGMIADNLRVYPRTRFPRDTVWITRDLTAFVGSGELDAAWVTGVGTDAVLTVLDTDNYTTAGVGFSREPIVYIRNVTANDQSPGLGMPVQFTRGCYVQLTGTNPQAWLSLRGGPVVRSGANYVDRGLRAR